MCNLLYFLRNLPSPVETVTLSYCFLNFTELKTTCRLKNVFPKCLFCAFDFYIGDSFDILMVYAVSGNENIKA